VQRQEANRRLNIFTRLGGKTDNLQSSTMNTFAKLINSNVGWCADKNLATIDLGKMIDDSRRGDGLSGSRGSLDED
jgi:hypothetical protein